VEHPLVAICLCPRPWRLWLRLWLPPGEARLRLRIVPWIYSLLATIYALLATYLLLARNRGPLLVVACICLRLLPAEVCLRLGLVCPKLANLKLDTQVQTNILSMGREHLLEEAPYCDLLAATVADGCLWRPLPTAAGCHLPLPLPLPLVRRMITPLLQVRGQTFTLHCATPMQMQPKNQKSTSRSPYPFQIGRTWSSGSTKHSTVRYPLIIKSSTP
jgi:hypothetical protein